jgi:hypothetical protein
MANFLVGDAAGGCEPCGSTGCGRDAARRRRTPGINSVREPGFVAFKERVEAYASLHRKLAASLPPLGSRIDRQSVMAARKFLASAIRAARPNASQGDIFTTEATVAFRQRHRRHDAPL